MGKHPLTPDGVEIQSREIDPYVILAYAIAMDHAQFKGAKNAFGIGLGGLGGIPTDF